jgi:glutamate synthase (NADPH/NADH) large chain
MSKMGISVISSYRGGLNFEAVGLSRSLVAEFFPGMPAAFPASGSGLQKKAMERGAPPSRGRRRCPSAASTRYRRKGETHAWEAQD